MIKYILLIASISLLGACSSLSNTPTSNETSLKVETQGMNHKDSFFVVSKGIRDGYVFIFHIMPAPEGEGFSRTNYHFMVSIENKDRVLTDLKLYSSVKHPNESKQATAMMMQMGDWYMAEYNLSHEQGRHWLEVSFEVDGETYSSGTYYPEYLFN